MKQRRVKPRKAKARSAYIPKMIEQRFGLTRIPCGGGFRVIRKSGYNPYDS